MKFEVATVDITPPIGVTLWGYEPRPSTWIEHPIEEALTEQVDAILAKAKKAMEV